MKKRVLSAFQNPKLQIVIDVYEIDTQLYLKFSFWYFYEHSLVGRIAYYDHLFKNRWQAKSIIKTQY